MSETTHPPSGGLAGREIGGRYLLLRVLARGGMAEVWMAEDVILGRDVAVKILHAHLINNPDIVRRFRDEAVAIARLNHRNIVSVYDNVVEDDIEAIVMELVDGVTLRQFLDRFGRMNVQDAVHLTAQVADGLEVAHDDGIVHRDIKPGNILLTSNRTVKITDFGIAKALEGGDTTETGTLLGTAKYLAPEQVEGLAVDPRADIYSLGAVVYEALCGQAPFNERTDAATALARLRRDPTPPRNLGVPVPEPVEFVIMKALSRSRDDRYDTVDEFREELIEAANQPTGSTPVVTVPDDNVDATLAQPGFGAHYAQPKYNPPVYDDPAYDDPPRSKWMRRLFMLVLIVGTLGLGVGLIVGTSAGSGWFEDVGASLGFGSNNDNAANLSVADLPVRGVRDFDPLGDDQEHPELIEFIIDDTPGTRWSTESYNTRTFAGIKPGVGFVIELDRVREVGGLEFITPTSGWSAEIYLSTETHGNLQRWGDPAATLTDISGSQSVTVAPTNAQFVMVWITDLGDLTPRARFDLQDVYVHPPLG